MIKENIRTRFLLSAKNMEGGINRALDMDAIEFRIERNKIIFVNEKEEVDYIFISYNKGEIIECAFQKDKWLQIRDAMQNCMEQPVTMVVEQTSIDTCEFTLTYSI